MDLDALVNDPRFLPYRGWHDGITSYPAIQQDREEFLEFVTKLNQRDRCLQIGLGTAGASQYVFQHLFQQAWTIENQQGNITHHQNIIFGDSHDPKTVAYCASLSLHSTSYS